MTAREKYLNRLKRRTDPIRAKDPSERTYKERWLLWYEERMNAPADAPYDCGEEREFYDGEALLNNKIKDGNGKDFPKWFREMGKHFGRKCISMDNERYTLVGMSETFEDYYYILQREDGSKCYHTCVGKITFK